MNRQRYHIQQVGAFKVNTTVYASLDRFVSRLLKRVVNSWFIVYGVHLKLQNPYSNVCVNIVQYEQPQYSEFSSELSSTF